MSIMCNNRNVNSLAVFAVTVLMLSCEGVVSPPANPPSDPNNPPSSDNPSNPGDPIGGNPGMPDDVVELPAEQCVSNTVSTAKDFPKKSLSERSIEGPFLSNGYSQTWDGRLFILGHGSQWQLRVFRPERIGQDGAGYPVFGNDVMSSGYTLAKENSGGMTMMLANAAVADPDFPRNPFPSDRSGNFDIRGSYETYRLIVVSTHYGPNEIGRRKAIAIVRNPRTRDAAIESAQMLESFQALRMANGDPLRGIEPSLTFDGRLMIWNGRPQNDEHNGHIMYSFNPNPASTAGWSTPKQLHEMHRDEANTIVAGIPFKDRYPIAAQPIKDFLGVEVPYRTGNAWNPKRFNYRGAYPWISLDGSEVFFTALTAGNNDLRPGEEAMRGGLSVVGRWTGWQMRHLDGQINPNRYAKTPKPTVRLFFSSPGAIPSMWRSYLDGSLDLPIPHSGHRPVFPLMGGNTKNYAEVTFEDVVDGDYLVLLRMNEAISTKYEVDPRWTPDTSGNAHNAELKNAKFPVEYNGQDTIVGRQGQAIYFPGASSIEIKNTQNLSKFKSGMTLSFFINWQNPANPQAQRIVSKDGEYWVEIDSSRTLRFYWTPSGAQPVSIVGPQVRSGQWDHVTFAVDFENNSLASFLNGERVRTEAVASTAPRAGTSALVMGPRNGASGQLLLIDEFKLSRVARSDSEIAIEAFRYQAPPKTAPNLPFSLPLGLRSRDVKVPMDNPLTSEKIALGKKLFEDPILSKSQTMSCLSCHASDQLFQDSQALTMGGDGRLLTRNTPTLINRLFSDRQFWDGRSPSLEAQALDPIVNPREMNLPIAEAVDRLKGAGYDAEFRRAFGRDVNATDLGRALASFQRSIVHGDSNVDRYEAGNASALRPGAVRGRDLFHNKARCIACHAGPNYTDELVHNTGFRCSTDLGAYHSSGRMSELRGMKTPTLRGIRQTAPYLHDGSVGTLRDMINRYNQGGVHSMNRDVEIYPLGLSEQEKRDLEEFLLEL